MRHNSGQVARLLRLMTGLGIGLLTVFPVVLNLTGSDSWADEGYQDQEEAEEIEDLADIEPTIPEGWQDLEHRELGFAVNLPPGRLRESVQPIETSLGTLEMYMIGLEDNERVYGVIVADFPDFFEVIPREIRFDGAISGILTNVRQRLVRDRQVALSGHPGRILLYEGEDGWVYQHHIYWVGTRLYQTIAAVPARLPQRQRAEFFETAKPFFQSFALTDAR